MALPTVFCELTDQIYQDEFRAGYSNWRKGGVKGSTGEAGRGVILGSVVNTTGLDGVREGYGSWRRGQSDFQCCITFLCFIHHASLLGGPAGSRDAGHSEDTRTRNTALVMTQEMAAVAATKGENWIRFFLHPDSDYHRQVLSEFRIVSLSIDANTLYIRCVAASSLCLCARQTFQH